MNLAYAAYNVISSGIFFLLLPVFGVYTCITGKHRESFGQRLGRYPDTLVRTATGKPRIWLHAASVGEVGVAAAIMDQLVRQMPGCAIVLSTTTEHGQAFAGPRLGPDAVCVYAPVDFVAAVRKALFTFKPDVLALVETEIWPNWLVQAQRMGIKTALVNGRISVRSIKGYLKVRGIMKETLTHVDAFSMIRESDAARIQRIGAQTEKVCVNGNAKYDLLVRQADPALRDRMTRLYQLDRNQPVFVAGSTRNGEETIILDAYSRVIERFPETLLIIAPRHVERAPAIKEMAGRRGFSCRMRTDLDQLNGVRTAPVIVMDTMGELPAAYSIATVAFCGGSLVPLGGQNVLEAAVWGIPVLYGPSMEDFMDAKALLENTGGGVQITDGQTLARRILHYLSCPDQAIAVGKQAREAVESHTGAAAKHADVICGLLGPIYQRSLSGGLKNGAPEFTAR